MPHFLCSGLFDGLSGVGLGGQAGSKILYIESRQISLLYGSSDVSLGCQPERNTCHTGNKEMAFLLCGSSGVASVGETMRKTFHIVGNQVVFPLYGSSGAFLGLQIDCNHCHRGSR